MTDLLKKKGDKKLRAQAAATFIGLGVAMLILFAAFVLSKLYLDGLQMKVTPMLDAALEAADAEDFETVNEYGKLIQKELLHAEPKLKLITSHRDIMEMMRYAEDWVLLDTDGDRMAYITDISGIRNWLELICEITDTSISDIL
ncbi:MAG: hypothetical protein J1E60_02255 [Christensenellaceae bacterium]|nr:hypothetical protein [Christensenellaceae bacterium]